MWHKRHKHAVSLSHIFPLLDLSIKTGFSSGLNMIILNILNFLIVLKLSLEIYSIQVMKSLVFLLYSFLNFLSFQIPDQNKRTDPLLLKN